MNYESKSDNELAIDYLKGDERSFEILISRYLKSIYRLAYGYALNVQEAEDITQDVFLKAWKNLKKFDTGKNFRTWIFSIAKNTALDFLKKKKSLSFSDFLDKETENTFKAEETSVFSGAFEIISKIAGKLSPRYRDLLFLRYNDDLTFRQIAECLNEPENSVRSRHRRALILLKKLLAGEF